MNGLSLKIPTKIWRIRESAGKEFFSNENSSPTHSPLYSSLLDPYSYYGTLLLLIDPLSYSVQKLIRAIPLLQLRFSYSSVLYLYFYSGTIIPSSIPILPAIPLLILG
jgi:hypothetical protein